MTTANILTPQPTGAPCHSDEIDPNKVELGVYMCPCGMRNNFSEVGFLVRGHRVRYTWMYGFLGEDDDGNDHGGRIWMVRKMGRSEKAGWAQCVAVGNGRFGKWTDDNGPDDIPKDYFKARNERARKEAEARS